MLCFFHVVHLKRCNAWVKGFRKSNCKVKPKGKDWQLVIIDIVRDLLVLCVIDLLRKHRYELHHPIVTKVTQISQGKHGTVKRFELILTVDSQADRLTELVPALEVFK